MKYAKPSTIDTPQQGCLHDARRWKANAWKALTSLRRELRECRMGEAGGLRLQIIKAERAHFEAAQLERECLRAIEARANELGLTTITGGASC